MLKAAATKTRACLVRERTARTQGAAVVGQAHFVAFSIKVDNSSEVAKLSVAILNKLSTELACAGLIGLLAGFLLEGMLGLRCAENLTPV